MTGIFSKPLKSDPIDWRGHPIDVLSLGCGDHAMLSESASTALGQADVVFGSARHIEEIAGYSTRAQMREFPSPFSELANDIGENQDKRLVLLASGDALFYGIGSWLTRLVEPRHLRFHPHISSIQYAFHAIGLPWQQAVVVSLHGRPLSSLRRHLRDRHLLALFTDSDSHPQAIARELCDQGFAQSGLWVCECLGSVSQKIQHFTASDLASESIEVAPLNTVIVQTRGHQPALPAFPGISDEHFVTGAEAGFGMISKRETRLAILSMMQPENGEIAWDIGAGCGSVSVEWARWNSQGQMYAIEQSAERIAMIEANSDKFGTTLNLIPVQGEAPHVCEDLPAPHSIFIGGSGHLGVMLEYALGKLRPGGKLVASAVTESSRRDLEKFLEGRPGRERVEIEVSKNLPGLARTRALHPVVLGKCIKDK